MPELQCECRVPFAWRALAAEMPDAATHAETLREATLLLTAINQMEAGHESESGDAGQKRLERLEAKLDLALHLLARALLPAEPPPERTVWLSPEEAAWPDDAPPAPGTSLELELRPSATLPLPLRLPAVALAAEGGQARARFIETTDGLSEALYQFVFRRHRQALRARNA